MAPFRPWRTWLPDDVSLGLVHLPGREARLAEAPCPTVETMRDDVLADVAAAAQGGYAVFGHSMGALLAYELAHHATEAGADAPKRLLVSGHRAPHVPDPRGPIRHDGDAALADEMERLGATPREVLDHPELMALLLPAFRADVRAARAYRHAAEPKLPCGLTVLGARDDEVAPPATVEPWTEHADDVRSHAFDGGHFYLHHDGRFRALMCEELGRLG